MAPHSHRDKIQQQLLPSLEPVDKTTRFLHSGQSSSSDLHILVG